MGPQAQASAADVRPADRREQPTEGREGARRMHWPVPKAAYYPMLSSNAQEVDCPKGLYFNQDHKTQNLNPIAQNLSLHLRPRQNISLPIVNHLLDYLPR